MNLIASDLEIGSSTVDVAGGSGGVTPAFNGTAASNSAPGTARLFVLGSNTALIQPSTLEGSAITGNEPSVSAEVQVAAPTATNPYLAGDPSTPKLAGTQVGLAGPGAGGVLTLSPTDTASLLAALDLSPAGIQKLSSGAGDVEAVVRVQAGTALGSATADGFSDNYPGYDMVLVINLSDVPLAAPTFGVGTSNAPLATGNVAISALNPGQIWATLVPANTAYTVHATVGAGTASAAAFANLNGTALNTITAASVAAHTITPAYIQYVGLTTPTAPGGGSIQGLNAMVQTADGNQIYGINTATGSLVAIDAASGREIQSFADGVDGVSGLAGATGLAFADGYNAATGTNFPDGYLFVTSATGGDDAAFSRDPATGALTFSDSAALPANFSTTVASSPSGAVYFGGPAGSVLWEVFKPPRAASLTSPR